MIVKSHFSVSALCLGFMLITILLLSEVIHYMTFYSNLITGLAVTKLCDVYLTNLQYAIGRRALLALDELLIKMKRGDIDLGHLKDSLLEKLKLEDLIETLSEDQVNVHISILDVELRRSSGGYYVTNHILGFPSRIPSGALELVIKLVIGVSCSNNYAGVKRVIRLVISHPIRFFDLLEIKKSIVSMNSTIQIIKWDEGNITEFVLSVVKRELLACLDESSSLKCSLTLEFLRENTSTFLCIVKIHNVEIIDELQDSFLKAKGMEVNGYIVLIFSCELERDSYIPFHETLTFHLFLKKN